jgi:hypothetical protein
MSTAVWITRNDQNCLGCWRDFWQSILRLYFASCSSNLVSWL